MFKTKNQRDALAHKSAAMAYNDLRKAEQTYNVRIEKLTQECTILDSEIRSLMQQKKQSSALLKLRERKIIERRKDSIERIRLNILTARIQLESQWDTLPAKEALTKFIEAQKQLLSQSQLKTIESLIENLDATNRQYEEMEDRTTELFAVSAPSTMDFSEDDLENELAQLMTNITVVVDKPINESVTLTPAAMATISQTKADMNDNNDEYQKILYLEQALPSIPTTTNVDGGVTSDNNAIYIQTRDVNTTTTSQASRSQEEQSQHYTPTKDILSELEEC